jgi:hypothetical protein
MNATITDLYYKDRQVLQSSTTMYVYHYSAILVEEIKKILEHNRRPNLNIWNKIQNLVRH